MKQPKREQAVIITGADSGIGEALTKEFLQRGFTVIVSYLQSHSFAENPSLHCCKMDIYEEYEIKHFVHFTKRVLRQQNLSLHSLINNAGIALGGSFEDIPLNFFRRVFEVNFFGVLSLTQKLIPLIIHNRAKIVMIGSLAGKIATPFLSPYASSKFALAGFCDSLRRELKPLGVEVILIAPAGIATPIWQKAEQQDTSFISSRYRVGIQHFMDKFVAEGKSGMDAEKCAFSIAKNLVKKRSKTRYIITTTPLLHRILLMLPDSWIDTIILKNFKIDYNKEGL